jgi:hypothetical protein
MTDILSPEEYNSEPSVKPTAATNLPDVKEPKVPAGKTTKVIPDYLGSTRGSTISDPSTNYVNIDIGADARAESTLKQTIKKLVLTSPDLSAAVQTKIETALTGGFTAVAYDATDRIEEQATEVVNVFLQRLNYMSYDYTKYTRSTDLRSLESSLLYDSFRYGSMGSELVLGEGRLPAYLKPIPMRLIDWADNTPYSYPIYTGGDEDVELNYPTIFTSTAIQDGETPYSDSPLGAAIQACLFDSAFVNDLRRAATKNLLQRLTVKINSEDYLNTLPVEVRTDKDKLREHMDATISALESQMSGLNPEDALVYFSVLDIDTIADANRSADREIEVLQALINGKIASGAKILPSVIGRGDSANSASTETYLFLKAISAAQLEVNILISRQLTLALRLLGYDVHVEFKFEEVNFRPELETESFKVQKQGRIMELLSTGHLSDAEASIELTGKLPPEGYKPLSGTFFKFNAADPTNNDYSNTSVDTSSGQPDSTQAQKDTES